MKAAEYQQIADGRVKCTLCPHGCVVAEGKSGLCGVRGVVDSELKALGYGMISSAHVDPIEKKPLNEFYPGSMIYSIGGWGCNLRCKFCQNWTISQQFISDQQPVAAEEVVRAALESGSIGIAYTYNEPLISIEFVKECAEIARKQGLKNVLVTNGYINKAPADSILPLVDALNIDIKSIKDAFYTEYCGGTLNPVLAFASSAVKEGCHVELTNLVIPGLNDSNSNFIELGVWIKTNLGSGVPLHLSAYRPEYKMSIEPTSVDTLLRARELCEKNVDRVYLGNVPKTYR